jgi:hypothetical protein
LFACPPCAGDSCGYRASRPLSTSLYGIVRLVETARSASAATHARTAAAPSRSCIKQGRAGEALPILEQVVEQWRKQFRADHWRVGDALLAYGKALAAEGRFSDAEPVLRAARAVLEKNAKARPRLAAQAAAAVEKLR